MHPGRLQLNMLFDLTTLGNRVRIESGKSMQSPLRPNSRQSATGALDLYPWDVGRYPTGHTSFQHILSERR